jgi:hypothetical protein
MEERCGSLRGFNMEAKMSSKSRRVAVLAVTIFLAMASSAIAAFVGLPPEAVQVNDDPAAGINPALSVNGEDPANADVASGALSAGQVAVPWAVLQQEESGGAHDQVFARSFADGTWMTRGSGTVGGRSSASPVFAGSLNFDQAQDGEAPAIDFAGAGRTVPWATWYEDTSGAGFGAENVFASRFDNSGDTNQGKWLFGGQGRGTGGGTVPVPSLNIHTNQDAENPVVAGGSTADATKPGPWVAWQETTTSPVNGKDEIFVERPLGPGEANCDGVTPAGTTDGSGHVPAVGGFCWQQTGIPRVGPGAADPSLNVDPTRNGVEPDIAFTGAQEKVPWVVWYEEGTGTIGGLHTNEMVFAAKGVASATADGGFEWVAVGNARSGKLDASEANELGGCAISSTVEGECSLNKSTEADAEDPRIAAGTMNPASATTPWIVWDERLNGVTQVFVSRLVGSGAAAHFEIVNNGAPISQGANDSTRADITFSANTPYVSWREDVGGGTEKALVGHFVNPTNPTFVLDQSNVPLSPSAQADVREPISSSCTATPFNGDGASCQGGALGTPFFLFTNGTSPRSLFANAYQPEALSTGGASSAGSSSATLNGTIDPAGASVSVFFQYGPTTAYGQATTPQSTGPSNVATSFAAQLTGLAAAATIHYRAVAVSDFGTFLGADQTLTTGAGQGPSSTSVPVHSKIGVTLTLVTKRLRDAIKAGKLKARVSVSRPSVVMIVASVKTLAAHVSKRGQKPKRLVVATAKSTFSVKLSGTVSIKLTKAGRQLLRKARRVSLNIAASAADAAGDRGSAVLSKTLKR